MKIDLIVGARPNFIPSRVSATAELVREIINPEAILSFDSSKPDGTPRKLLDVSKLHQFGWPHRMALRDGIADTYEWFVRRQVEPAATGSI